MAVVFQWLATLSFFGLLARLAVVQLVDHDYYYTLAKENRIKLLILPASRGAIYDKNGQVLARDAAAGREYPLGEAAGHPVGFAGGGAGEVSGRGGLEREYDDLLNGKNGGILVEVDSLGNKLREISRQEPAAGKDLTITLDAGLQSEAYRVLAGRKGAVVAADPQSGAVLALVSSPGFSPAAVAKYLNSPDQPLFNRALGGVYPPGSTFKIIAAAAGLEEKVIDEGALIEDTGRVTIGEYTYGNWYFTQYGRTDGSLNIVGAIKRSNDIFFYRLGERLGISRLAEWAKWFGVGSATGIDLPGEAPGLMPDPVWKEAVKKEPWYLGDTLITAIGQGNILMTPLQVNTVTGVIASGGRWCRPHFAGGPDCRKLDLAGKTVALIGEGMRQVARPGGTAWPFFGFPVPVAGKTGTAEYGGAEGKTHAWFTVFAPADEPAIVLTVLLEGGGEGSNQAAPLAKELLSYWFNR